MTVPPTPPPRRSALRWAIVAVVIVLVLLVPVLMLRSASSVLGRFGQPSEPNITQQTVVEKLREVAKLVATEMTLRDVVTFEQTRYGSTKKALLVVTGRVAAGIDLEHGTEVRIDSAERRISVTLPPAQLLSVDVLNVVTYDERAGLLNPFRAEDRDAMGRRVRSQLMEAARQSGILQHADESAARAVQELLTRDGYRVEIVRPPLQAPPKG